MLRMKNSLLLAVGITLASALCAEPAHPPFEPLYPKGKGNVAGEGLKHNPALMWYPAPATNNTGKCVVVFPGGGYGMLCWSYEGVEVGEFFQKHGITAVICLYRCAEGGYRHPVPLQDAQQAIRRARQDADRYGYSRDRVGVMGFSAGGHLAASAMTHYDAETRPDFGILCYPVIKFGEKATHLGSQYNLIGKDADAETVKSLSCEKQVTKDTPQAFIWACATDQLVPSANAESFHAALRAHGVPSELHIFRQGWHGGGLCFDPTEGLPRAVWTELLLDWMRTF